MVPQSGRSILPPMAEATHDVFNQPPPLDDINVFARDRVAGRGAAARGRGLGRERAAGVRRDRRAARRIALGRPGQQAPAGAAHARPLRQPHRRGRVPPGLARADARRRSSTGCTPCPGASRAPARTWRARRCSCCWPQVEAGYGCPISMTYSAVPALRRQPELAARVGAAAHLARLRSAAAAGRREGGRALRHGDDREAGRLATCAPTRRAPSADRATASTS